MHMIGHDRNGNQSPVSNGCSLFELLDQDLRLLQSQSDRLALQRLPSCLMKPGQMRNHGRLELVMFLASRVPCVPRAGDGAPWIARKPLTIGGPINNQYRS